MADSGKEGKEDQGPDLSWLPEGTEPLADGDYDAIVMGTGLKECIMSGLLSVLGKKVLHIDRNNYYGGDCASLSLVQLFQKFKPGITAEQVEALGLGRSRDYNVDLIPKFIMACGDLVKILLHTKVTRYLEFKNVDGSYVYKAGKVHKVPATLDEALRTSLVGFFEKRRFRSFLSYLAKYDDNDPKTSDGLDLNRMTARQLYEKFSLDDGTRAFTGHAMALFRDDSYLDRPAIEMVRAIQLYVYSLERYGKSPYLYPMYGLGGLPEGFSRMCAINGGTFMLDHSVDEVLFKDGQAWAIRHGNQVARGKIFVGDPSYFPANKSRVTGRVVRSIFLMDHPVADTGNSESVQIIIPASEVPGRSHDIYVAVVSHAHCVAANNMFIGIASTRVETSDPLAELEPAARLLRPFKQRFDSVVDTYQPVGTGVDDKCFISTSYDATSHFETTAEDVLSLYRRVTGTNLDMTISADSTDADDA